MLSSKRIALLAAALGVCLLLPLCACEGQESAETVTDGSAVTAPTSSAESAVGDDIQAPSRDTTQTAAPDGEPTDEPADESDGEPTDEPTDEPAETNEPDAGDTTSPVIELPKVEFD